MSSSVAVTSHYQGHLSRRVRSALEKVHLILKQERKNKHMTVLVTSGMVIPMDWIQIVRNQLQSYLLAPALNIPCT